MHFDDIINVVCCNKKKDLHSYFSILHVSCFCHAPQQITSLNSVYTRNITLRRADIPEFFFNYA